MNQRSPRFVSSSREWDGKLRTEDLDGRRLYVCSKCLTHVADHEDIISKARRSGCNRRFHLRVQSFPIDPPDVAW